MGLILIGVFFGELLVSLKVGLLIGFGWSVVCIVSSALLGGVLIQLSPYALMHTFNTMTLSDFGLRNAQNTAVSYMLAAVLLIIPGVMTDVLGGLLLLYVLYLRLFATITNTTQYTNYTHNKGDDNVIDVEIVDESDSSKPVG